MADERVEDLDVPDSESEDVTGGVAAGDGPAAFEGDPDQPIVVGKLPGKRTPPTVTLKRG
jgi:hypothetical protein